MTSAERERERVGLCASCAWLRRVPSSRAQTYYLCGRSLSEPRFRKYPVLPVVRCHGFEPVDPGPGHSTSG